MGLGGHLTWTAVAREMVNAGIAEKVLPCEIIAGQYVKVVESEIWKNNPYITINTADFQKNKAALLQLNNPETNYCKLDTPTMCRQRADKHCIEQICEHYGIKDPELRCEIFFTDQELETIKKIVNDLDGKYIVIEPHSKKDYTPNKEYSFDKWQKIVDEISKHIQVVQVGNKKEKILDNVIDLVGKTTFREAVGIIRDSCLFLSTEGGLIHASTAVDTQSLVIMTGYQSPVLWSYPQNTNIYIGTHGPCGLKKLCNQCIEDIKSHDEKEVIDKIMDFIGRQ